MANTRGGRTLTKADIVARLRDATGLSWGESGELLEAVLDEMKRSLESGENIKISRHHRMEVSGNGVVAGYIHTGGKVGVLVEVGAGKQETTANEEFKQLVRDVTLQIAASSPVAVSRESVPADLVAKEREIAASSDRLKGKPPQAMEKILQGVIEKYYQTVCLVDQGFVKNPEVTVKQHVDTVGK